MIGNTATLEPFFASVMLTVQGRAPLLGDARRARLVMRVLEQCAHEAPGHLWGYVVLPHAVRLVAGPCGRDSLRAFVNLVKARTTPPLVEAIRRADDDSLDAILRYNPVWGGAIFRVWDEGFHCKAFWAEAKLSNALLALRQAPVALGLVADPADWPFRR